MQGGIQFVLSPMYFVSSMKATGILVNLQYNLSALVKVSVKSVFLGSGLFETFWNFMCNASRDSSVQSVAHL